MEVNEIRCKKYKIMIKGIAYIQMFLLVMVVFSSCESVNSSENEDTLGQVDNPINLEMVNSRFYMNGATLFVDEMLDSSFINLAYDSCIVLSNGSCLERSEINYVYDVYHCTTKIMDSIDYKVSAGRLFFEYGSLLFQQFSDQIFIHNSAKDSVISFGNVIVSFELDECRGEEFLRYAEVQNIENNELSFFKETYIEIDSTIIMDQNYSGSLVYEEGDRYFPGHFKFVEN